MSSQPSTSDSAPSDKTMKHAVRVTGYLKGTFGTLLKHVQVSNDTMNKVNITPSSYEKLTPDQLTDILTRILEVRSLASQLTAALGLNKELIQQFTCSVLAEHPSQYSAYNAKVGCITNRIKAAMGPTSNKRRSSDGPNSKPKKFKSFKSPEFVTSPKDTLPPSAKSTSSTVAKKTVANKKS